MNEEEIFKLFQQYQHIQVFIFSERLQKEIFKLFQQYQHIQIFIFSDRLQKLIYTKILQLIPNIYI